MKKALLFFLACYCFTAAGQVNGDFKIDWSTNNKMTIGTYNYKIPQFQQKQFYFDIVDKSILLMLKLPVKSSVDEATLEITNTVFETIAITDLGDLSLNAIPTAINARVKNINARADLFVTLSLSPIIKEGNTYKR